MVPRNTEFNQFNEKVAEYANFVGGDPIRNYLQYPALIDELGDISGKRVLDVGCGDGYFARMLASNNKAEVIGYDKGEDLIRTAQAAVQPKNPNVKFLVADAETFKAEKRFDYAVSMMVLPYAQDEEHLKRIFQSTCGSLNEGGKFISIVLNPDLKAFGDVIPNRKMALLEDGKVEISFLDPKTGVAKLGARLNQFSKQTYEEASVSGGFASSRWKPLNPTTAGESMLGKNFWQKIISEQPYSLLIAEK